MCVCGGSLEGERPRREANPVFLFGRPERCRTVREKREKLEGSREEEVRGLIMQGREERAEQEAKPCQNGEDGMRGRGRGPR